MHFIKLNGYNATTENGKKLELGTFDSYGEEQLKIVKALDAASDVTSENAETNEQIKNDA